MENISYLACFKNVGLVISLFWVCIITRRWGVVWCTRVNNYPLNWDKSLEIFDAFRIKTFKKCRLWYCIPQTTYPIMCKVVADWHRYYYGWKLLNYAHKNKCLWIDLCIDISFLYYFWNHFNTNRRDESKFETANWQRLLYSIYIYI